MKSSLPLATPAARAMATALVLAASATTAHAMAVAPTVVCDTYPDADTCRGTQPACTLCHTAPPVRNDFGLQVEAALAPGMPRPLDIDAFAAALPAALMAVEALDADGDGTANFDELQAGTLPGDAASKPGEGGLAVCEANTARTWAYNVCDRDAVYTYRKVMLDFCGRSPTLSEIEGLSASADAWRAIHDTLDLCLGGNFWRGRDGVLWNLANRKIRPSAAIKSGEDPGSIPLADYDDDYNLFVYNQIDDHDARELLTAQYFVARDDGDFTTYTPFTRTPAEDLAERGIGGVQIVDIERRAGMLTTRWFLMSNTMFTPIPRTTAAQAYRSYLGLDIARMEGLMPVANEPVDYDAKSVDQPACAVCHATLDPLTYPFTRYEGITGGAGGGGLPASYNADRLDRFGATDAPTTPDAPEAGVILGQPVADLLAWAQVAANSNEFARTTALDYWQLLVGEPPRQADRDTFDGLWQAFAGEHGYSVERMLHDLIDTEAYSVP